MNYSEQMLLEKIVRLEKEMEELRDNQKKDKRLIDYLYDKAERTDIEGSV